MNDRCDTIIKKLIINIIIYYEDIENTSVVFELLNIDNVPIYIYSNNTRNIKGKKKKKIIITFLNLDIYDNLILQVKYLGM